MQSFEISKLQNSKAWKKFVELETNEHMRLYTIVHGLPKSKYLSSNTIYEVIIRLRKNSIDLTALFFKNIVQNRNPNHFTSSSYHDQEIHIHY